VTLVIDVDPARGGRRPPRRTLDRDAAGLVAIERPPRPPAGHRDDRSGARARRARLVVARVGGEVVGFAGSRTWPASPTCMALAVARRWQRRGIGADCSRALVAEAETAGRGRADPRGACRTPWPGACTVAPGSSRRARAPATTRRRGRRHRLAEVTHAGARDRDVLRRDRRRASSRTARRCGQRRRLAGRAARRLRRGGARGGGTRTPGADAADHRQTALERCRCPPDDSTRSR
jgi:hypothetical protein